MSKCHIVGSHMSRFKFKASQVGSVLNDVLFSYEKNTYPVEISHLVAFYLGLFCLSRCAFSGF